MQTYCVLLLLQVQPSKYMHPLPDMLSYAPPTAPCILHTTAPILVHSQHAVHAGP
jgi:hypothetical protein